MQSSNAIASFKITKKYKLVLTVMVDKLRDICRLNRRNEKLLVDWKNWLLEFPLHDIFIPLFHKFFSDWLVHLLPIKILEIRLSYKFLCRICKIIISKRSAVQLFLKFLKNESNFIFDFLLAIFYDSQLKTFTLKSFVLISQFLFDSKVFFYLAKSKQILDFRFCVSYT